MYLLKKKLHISEMVQFRSMLFKGQLYTFVHYVGGYEKSIVRVFYGSLRSQCLGVWWPYGKHIQRKSCPAFRIFFKLKNNWFTMFLVYSKMIELCVCVCLCICIVFLYSFPLCVCIYIYIYRYCFSLFFSIMVYYRTSSVISCAIQ